jgi:molybdate transport system permease protein
MILVGSGARRGSGGLNATMGGLGGVAVLVLLLPVIALAARTPWSRFGQLITEPRVVSALRVSLLASLGSLLVSAVLGVPLAWVLARFDFPLKNWLRALTTLPMVLPPVVGGVALLLAFGRRGLVGEPISQLTGASLPFTLGGVILAETFVAMPFLVVTLEAALRAVDQRFEDAAASLGARGGYVFRRVTVPMVSSSLGAGMAMCWARALGEFGATITFAGNLPGRTQTMPLAVYLQLETNPEAAYLLSFILLAISILVLVVVGGRVLGSR